MILHKKFQVIPSKNEGMTAIFAIFDFLKKFFQKPPAGPVGPAGPLGARRAPYPPQELEGRARSTLNF